MDKQSDQSTKTGRAKWPEKTAGERTFNCCHLSGDASAHRHRTCLTWHNNRRAKELHRRGGGGGGRGQPPESKSILCHRWQMNSLNEAPIGKCRLVTRRSMAIYYG